MAEQPPPGDSPAAHSMDSVWFAVDGEGRVAALSTGENGHIPSEGNGGYGNDVLEGLREHLGVPEQEDILERLLALGIFWYVYSEDSAPEDTHDRYLRGLVPTARLHIDQLPPALRKRFLPFPALRFTEAERFQPLEFYPSCDSCNEDACAYLCADGKTVKPIPGEEDHFADFVQHLRQSYPTGAAEFIFEGPLEAPEEEAPGTEGE